MEYQWDYMIRFYQLREIKEQSFEKALQELGKLGWELSSIQNIPGMDRKNDGLTFFFKRPMKAKTERSPVDQRQVQYAAPTKRLKESDLQGKRVLSSQDSTSLYPSNVIPRAISDGEEQEAEAVKSFKKDFLPILEDRLNEGEEITYAMQKNERHGLAVTKMRLLLVKDEAWGNPKVIATEFVDTFEVDLRKFLDKYDFSVRYYDRPNEMERIEVIALEEEHLEKLVELVDYMRTAMSSMGRNLIMQGLLLKMIPQ